jgi:hypothetical protein
MNFLRKHSLIIFATLIIISLTIEDYYRHDRFPFNKSAHRATK